MKLQNLLLNNKCLGQAMFLVLFILAAVFYLERTIFVDPCYAVFNILYYCDYVTEAGRYTAVIPQTLPLIAMNLGLPLKFILGIYSISFILLYYLIYLVIAYGFRLDRLALAIPLLLLVGIKYSFYWISTETHQALVYTVLFYAFLTWSNTLRPGLFTSVLRIAFAAGILLLGFYCHPIAVFTMLFALGFFILANKLWFKPDSYVLAGLIVALAVMKFLTSDPAGYESTFFRGFADFFNRVGDIGSSGSFQFLRVKLFNIYLFPGIILLVTSAWYVVHKEYLKLIFCLGSLLLFSLILFTTFDIFFYPFIQEKNLMGLNLFLLIPFLNDVVFADNRKKLMTGGFIVVMAVAGIAHVVSGSTYFNRRLDYIHSIVTTVHRFPQKKFVMGEDLVDRDRLQVNWALAPETLILSSLEGPDSSVSVYVNDAYGKLGEDTSLDDSLLLICAPWAKHLDVSRLNKRYFNLDGSSYRTLTEKEMVAGSDIGLLALHFDDPSFRAGIDSSFRDAAGQGYFILKSEFSPGFYGTFGQITNRPALLVTASVRIRPFEKIDPTWLNLIISREKDQVVKDYHTAGITPPDSLKYGEWNTITVSGIIRSANPAEQVKVYLWNPGKKRVGLDDLVITYRVIDR